MSSASGVQTARESLSSQAYSSQLGVLETLAHELRQPLSAIESIAYYLDLVLDRGDYRAREHAARLHVLVEQSSWLLSCVLELSNPRPLRPAWINLEEVITQAIVAHVLPGARGPELIFAENLPLVYLDPGRARTFAENMLAMFTRLSSPVHNVRITTVAIANEVHLQFSVDTPGYQNEAALGPGAAIGMQGLRRMVETHGGSLKLTIDAINGIHARVILPAAEFASASFPQQCNQMQAEQTMAR